MDLLRAMPLLFLSIVTCALGDEPAKADHAQRMSNDASLAQYREAFAIFQKAENLAMDGNTTEAVKAYEEALQMLRRLSEKTHPDLHPLIEWRIRRISEVSARLQGKPLPPAAVLNPAQARYVEAYQVFQEAEDLKKAGKPEAAMDAYRRAKKTFDSLRDDFPDFEPFIVGYRLGRIEEMLSGAKASQNAK